VFCGDLNSMPGSVVLALCEGGVAVRHTFTPMREGDDEESGACEPEAAPPAVETFEPPLRLHSAYEPPPAYTTLTDTFRGRLGRTEPRSEPPRAASRPRCWSRLPRPHPPHPPLEVPGHPRHDRRGTPPPPSPAYLLSCRRHACRGRVRDSSEPVPFPAQADILAEKSLPSSRFPSDHMPVLAVLSLGGADAGERATNEDDEWSDRSYKSYDSAQDDRPWH